MIFQSACAVPRIAVKRQKKKWRGIPDVHRSTTLWAAGASSCTLPTKPAPIFLWPATAPREVSNQIIPCV